MQFDVFGDIRFDASIVRQSTRISEWVELRISMVDTIGSVVSVMVGEVALDRIGLVVSVTL